MGHGRHARLHETQAEAAIDGSKISRGESRPRHLRVSLACVVV